MNTRARLHYTVPDITRASAALDDDDDDDMRLDDMTTTTKPEYRHVISGLPCTAPHHQPTNLRPSIQKRHWPDCRRTASSSSRSRPHRHQLLLAAS